MLESTNLVTEENIKHITSVLKKHFNNLSVEKIIEIVFEILKGLK